MKLWWLADSVRLAAEKAAVEQLAAEQAWFDAGPLDYRRVGLAAEGAIIAHGDSYPVRLVYPRPVSERARLGPAARPGREVERPSVREGRHALPGAPTRQLVARGDRRGCPAQRLQPPTDRESSRRRRARASGIGPIKSGMCSGTDWGRSPVLIGAGCFERLRQRLLANFAPCAGRRRTMSGRFWSSTLSEPSRPRRPALF